MTTPTLPRKKYRLRNMNVDRVDLVDRGANQYADIVFFKGQPEMGDVHEKTVPKKKRKKGDPLTDAKAALEKHYGPGDHKDGSSQDVHGGGGGGNSKAPKPKVPSRGTGEGASKPPAGRSERRAGPRGHLNEQEAKKVAAFLGTPREKFVLDRVAESSGVPRNRIYGQVQMWQDEWDSQALKKSTPGRARALRALAAAKKRNKRRMAEGKKPIVEGKEVSPSSLSKHYGPGPHDSGSSQDVHGEGGGGGEPVRGYMGTQGSNDQIREYNRGKMTPGGPTPLKTKSGHRSLSTIAREINSDWSKKGKGVNFAAQPYLSAMRQLDDITDMYGADDARSVVAYFLSNARSWTGPKAKEVKAELKSILNMRKSAPPIEPVLKAFTDALIEADVFIEDATPEELRDMLSDKALAEIGKTLLSAESADAIEEYDMAIDIDALDLPDEVTEYIGNLEETVTELTKALEDAFEDDVDDDAGDPIAKALNELPEDVAAIFKAREERLVQLETDLRKQHDDTSDREYIAKAATYAHVIESPELFGPDLRRVAEFDPEVAKRLETILETASARLAKSKLLDEIGTGIPSESVGAFEKATAIAKSMVNEGTAATVEEARAQVWTMNPELFDEYRQELNSRA